MLAGSANAEAQPASIEQLEDTLAQRLDQLLAGTRAGTAGIFVRVHAPLRDSDGLLEEKLRSVARAKLASRVRSYAWTDAYPMPAHELSVALELHLEGGFLRVIVRVAESPAGFRRLFVPSSSFSERTATLRVPLDAYSRRFVDALPVATEESIRGRRLALPGRSFLGIACADLDGQDGSEIVLLREREVLAIRLRPRANGRGLRAEELARAELRLDRNPVPSRRTIGFLTTVGDAIVGRSSFYAGSFIVRPGPGTTLDVQPSTRCPGAYPMGDLCARQVQGRDYFHAELTDLAGELRETSAGFYARSERQIVQPDGSELTMEVLVTPRGRLGARVGEQRSGDVGYGAAAALADIDQDGSGEVLASSSRPVGSGDELIVLRLRADGRLYSLWRSDEVGGSILVAGAGDVDGDGVEELLAIEEPRETNQRATLWIVDGEGP